MDTIDISVGSSTRNPTDKLEVKALFSICDEWVFVERYVSEDVADDPRALAAFADNLISGAVVGAIEKLRDRVAEQVKANVIAYRSL